MAEFRPRDGLMRLSNEFISRIFGAIAGGIAGAYFGARLAEWIGVGSEEVAYVMVFGLLGVMSGLILTPIFTVRPVRRTRNSLIAMPAERLVAIIGGIFLGLIAASLLTLPLSTLPAPFRQIVPIASAILLCYLSVVILSLRQNDLRATLSVLRSDRKPARAPSAVEEQVILLDTSVIIDDRISELLPRAVERS